MTTSDAISSLPGGKREMFTFNPTRYLVDAGPFSGIVNGLNPLWLPTFTPAAGVTDTLSVDPGYITTLDNATYVGDANNQAYNPANPVFGGHYILTTKDGLKYDISTARAIKKLIRASCGLFIIEL